MKKIRRLRLAGVLLLTALVFVAGSRLAYHLWENKTLNPDAPLIGISLDTSWYNRLGITRLPYQMAVVRAGGRYLTFRHGERTPSEILEQIDGLLLTGGGDIDHALTGEREKGWHVDRARDNFELALVRGALDRDMPVLGVCRGIQILNVALGGSLRELREDELLLKTHGIGLNSFKAHSVTFVPGSALAGFSPAGGRAVSSFHRHIVHRLGEGVQVSASSPDGLIEAVEIPDRRFVYGVQWHPEWQALGDPAYLSVFRALVRAASDYRQ